MMPHLPYADAVHAALTAAGHTPATVHAYEDDRGDLIARYEWPDVEVVLLWTSGTGWRYEAPSGGGPLFVDTIADPAALAEAVALIADGRPPHRSTARWTNAPVLDRALSDRESQ